MGHEDQLAVVFLGQQIGNRRNEPLVSHLHFRQLGATFRAGSHLVVGSCPSVGIVFGAGIYCGIGFRHNLYAPQAFLYRLHCLLNREIHVLETDGSEANRSLGRNHPGIELLGANFGIDHQGRLALSSDLLHLGSSQGFVQSRNGAEDVINQDASTAVFGNFQGSSGLALHHQDSLQQRVGAQEQLEVFCSGAIACSTARPRPRPIHAFLVKLHGAAQVTFGGVELAEVEIGRAQVRAQAIFARRTSPECIAMMANIKGVSLL